MRRLTPGTLILGVFAVLLGLIGAYGVKKFLDRPAPVQAEAPKPKVETYQVPVAADNLPAGRTLTQDDVMVMPMTAEQVAKAKLPSFWMSQVAQISGRTIRNPVKQGQAFEPSMFYPKGMGPKLADQLKPGERAVTLSLEHGSVDSTFVTPGTIVDVLFRAKPDSTTSVPDVTVTLLTNVRVLALGQNTVEGTVATTGPTTTGETQSVTLAVNQAQARALKVVEGRGSLSLVLRSDEDKQLADTGGPSTLMGMLGVKEPAAPFVSEIYRRTSRSSQVFRDGQREKITLDPPYGMPVIETPPEKKAKGLEALYPWQWGGWGAWPWYGGSNAYGNGAYGYGGIGPTGPF